MRNALAEDVGDVLDCIVGVLHDVVEQRCADAGRTESHLLNGNSCHSNRMHDVRFARKSAHAFVSLSCEVESFVYDVNLSAVS